MSDLLSPTVSGLGYELLGVETSRAKNGSLVRLYIDSPTGITVDDCERVSRQVGDVLEVEQALRGEYTLEVSSPGVDRPLFTIAQYRKHVGEKVTMRLATLFNGRRKLQGELQAVTDDTVALAENEEIFEVPFRLIEHSRLVPQWND